MFGEFYIKHYKGNKDRFVRLVGTCHGTGEREFP